LLFQNRRQKWLYERNEQGGRKRRDKQEKSKKERGKKSCWLSHCLVTGDTRPERNKEEESEETNKRKGRKKSKVLQALYVSAACRPSGCFGTADTNDCTTSAKN
jgi:hypothetical protein